MTAKTLPSRSFRSILRDRKGVSALEYGLLAALIAAAVITAATTFGGSLNTAFDGLGNKLEAEVNKVGASGAGAGGSR